MTLAIAVFTFIPPLADLATDTHVFHPGWMPHARVHTVWLLGLTSSVGLLALYFLWVRKLDPSFGEDLAGVLGAIVYGSFFLGGSTVGSPIDPRSASAGLAPVAPDLGTPGRRSSRSMSGSRNRNGEVDGRDDIVLHGHRNTRRRSEH